MLGKKHECAMCHTSETTLWKKLYNESIICNDCATNKTTCLPTNRNSRSSSPDAAAESDPCSQPKVRKLDNDNSNSNNKEDCRDLAKKIRDDSSKDCMDNNREGTNGSYSGNKNKSTKEKNKKDEHEDKDDGKREPRRKTRKGKQGTKGSIPKGKGRRYIFKKSAMKAPAPVSVPVTSDSLMYKGQYYQVGDVVSVEDVDGGRYYCQVRGLLQDQYCEKSAVLTWLLPTVHSPPPEQKFDPSTYIIGPEEELPRKMEYLEFVCHAPSDYYKLMNSPYPTATTGQHHGSYIWARITPPTPTMAARSAR
uniref:GATA zinc finger domain-containing protein 1 n=1 Tax=Hirondellea gigas TaxID=1518452 RepID=A0A2P2I542_9CRUS